MQKTSIQIDTMPAPARIILTEVMALARQKLEPKPDKPKQLEAIEVRIIGFLKDSMQAGATAEQAQEAAFQVLERSLGIQR